MRRVGQSQDSDGREPKQQRIQRWRHANNKYGTSSAFNDAWANELTGETDRRSSGLLVPSSAGDVRNLMDRAAELKELRTCVSRAQVRHPQAPQCCQLYSRREHLSSKAVITRRHF